MAPRDQGVGPGLRRLALAVDRSAGSLAAELATAALASRAGADVIVVHVWTRGHWAIDIEEEAQELAQGVVSDLGAFGVRATADVRSSAPERVIEEIEVAIRHASPDLVVMGTRGRTELGGVLFGSLSRSLLARLDMPVMLVRAGKRSVARRTRILVALGGDEDVSAIVDAVRRVAEPGAGALVYHRTAGRPTAEAATVAVHNAVAGLQEFGIRAYGRFAHGDDDLPSDIVEAARTFQADLIVLGSRRPSDLAGFLRGSVAHEVSHLVDGLLLIGPRKADDATTSGTPDGEG